jgi:serine/threonine protein kinase
MKIGRYEVIRKLATGGMAEVFLAKAAGPLGFEKTLVVKRILPHLVDESAFVEMFLAEAKLVAQLNHPHIVQIFDFGDADGAYFLAMEYIDGPNLRTLLKQARTLGMLLPPALCAKMVAAACEGLAYAHDFRDPATQQPLNLIHRDISTDNILLSRQGAVKVADFGIAKAAGHGPKTQEGILKGKLPYMSPEHLRGWKLDRRADVYALGLVLYELLTCRKPFEATIEADVLRAILDAPFIPAVERRPELPSPLQQILDRALAKERNERYQDCLSFQADLDQFVLSAGEAVGSLHIARLITHLEAAPAKNTSQASPAVAAPPTSDSTESPQTLSLAQADALAASESPTLPTNGIPSSHQDKTVAGRSLEHAVIVRPESVNVLDEADLLEKNMRSRGRWYVVVSTFAALLFIGGGGYLVWHGDSVRLDEPPDEPLAIQFSPMTDAGPLPPDAGLRSESGAQEADAGSPAPTLPPIVEAEPVPPPASRPTPPRPKVVRPAPENSEREIPSKTLVTFRVVPYATVFLDEKEIGTTPFDPIEVSPGRHIVRLVNRELSKTELRAIDLKPGTNLVIKHNFETR